MIERRNGMKHTYCESFDKKDIENIYLKWKPDIYKLYTRRDLRTLCTIYCIDMWFIETNSEREKYI